MISSSSNNRIKRLVALGKKAKFRTEEGVFLVEGEKMLREAPREWIREIYFSETFFNKRKEFIQKIVRESVNIMEKELLADEVFQKVSDTQTPQGVLGVLSMPQYTWEEYMANWSSMQSKAPLLLLLEDLQDPGNLGTILRAGEGAGVSGIVMTRNTVDLFNPKTIRSTMGSIYRMPFFVTQDLGNTIELLKENDICVYAAHLDDSVNYDVPDYTRPTAFLIGNEGNGLNRATADKATQYVKIPMEGQVESLNGAVATAILIYEAARQRRQ